MDKLLSQATEDELLAELNKRRWPGAGGHLYVQSGPHRFRGPKGPNWALLDEQNAWHRCTIVREGKDAIVIPNTKEGVARTTLKDTRNV